MELPDKLTLRALLNNSAECFAELPALGFAGETPLRYREVSDRVGELTALLHDLGIGRGDRIALLSQNMPNWGVAYLAITGMGAVVVPILTDFTPLEIKKILSHSEARTILVSEKLIEKLQQELPPGLKSAVLTDDFSPISLGSMEVYGKVEKLTRTVAAAPDIPEPREDDLAAILYTSGTTGKPKGVMLSHKNIMSNAVNTLGIQRVDSSDRLLSVLPLPHTYECTIGFIIPFMTGAWVNYLDKLPTPAVLLPAMEVVKPTMMLTVPLIIEKVYKNRVLPKLSGSALMRQLTKLRPVQKAFHKLAGKKIYKAFGGKLRFFGIGGAKLSATTERFLRDAGFPYAIGYGLTETSPLLAGCSPDLTKFQSTGFCLPGQELRILDPDPVSAEGEIITRGPNVMQGDYKQEEQTREVFTNDGWFRTGDLGYIDQDGYLFIRGRIKNVIVSATGENIYPEDIEAVINSERHVLESLVYEWRGKLVARVHLNYEEIDQRYHEMKESAGHLYEQMQQKVKDRLAEIQSRVNARLNRFSRLSTIEEQDEPFQKTPTKKIKRFLYFKKQQ